MFHFLFMNFNLLSLLLFLTSNIIYEDFRYKRIEYPAGGGGGVERKGNVKYLKKSPLLSHKDFVTTNRILTDTQTTSISTHRKVSKKNFNF